MLPAKAGFKFKSKIPDFERGKEKFLTTPFEIHRDRLEYMEYFEDKAKASLRAKFEPDIPPQWREAKGGVLQRSRYI